MFILSRWRRGLFDRQPSGLWGAIVVALIAVWICLPLFKDSFLVTHDYINNILKHLSMRHYFGKGQILPVWVPDYYYGYGGATFIFYPPFFFLVSALLDLIGFSPALAINLTCFLSVLGSGLAMYAYLRSLAGVYAGILGAVIYMAAPYHIVDLYVRGAYAESMAFVFLPLIFWGLTQVVGERLRNGVLMTALATAGLLLTHNCISLIFMPFAFAYIVFLSLGARFRKTALIGLFSMALGAGLSAFFWLPALLEKRYLSLERFTGGLLNYRLHLLDPVQLFFSPNQYGANSFLLRLSFQIGWVLLGIVVLGVVFAMLWAAQPLRRKFLFFWVSAIIALWMTTIYSRWLWEAMPLLQMVQFPWRFLTLVVFFLSLLAGGVGCIPYRRWAVLVCALMVAFFLLVRLADCRAGSYDALPNARSPEAMKVINPAGNEWDYVPAVAQQELRVRADRPLEFSAAGVDILAYERLSPINHRFLVTARTAAQALFNQYVFPGWRVDVDGQVVNMVENKYGLLAFPIPSGRHEIRIAFHPTAIRLVGRGISLMCLLGVFLLWLRFSRWEKV